VALASSPPASPASASASPPPSPGRASAFASAPHTSLSMDESVKDALLCGNNF
jgi:hypothetical protein